MIVGLINNIGQPAQLHKLSRRQWPWTPKNLIEVWRSKRFLVQIYQEAEGIVRMSVNTTEFGGHRRFADGISWDDLQKLKAECGRSNCFAVEVYPPDCDVVNVANMRHLWIYPDGAEIPFAWRKGV